MKRAIPLLTCLLLMACGSDSSSLPTSARQVTDEHAPRPPAPGGGDPGQDSRPVGDPAGPTDTPPLCSPLRGPIEITGSIAEADAKTYRMQPFQVAPGTGRIELSYGWSDHMPLSSLPTAGSLAASTLDLGLWDQRGYRSAAGFRGWSGSRQGRIDRQQKPVFVQADSADRGYRPGAITPGVWYAELGVGAVAPQGADWILKIECKQAGGATPADDPVNARHVARTSAGWYHGDFHMHAYHSNPNAPDWDEFVQRSRAAGLDFLMVTEYVTTQHWRTLGAVQRAHPDLLIWPGREIITYHGHVMSHGETPRLAEYRHGFEDVDIGNIQKAIRADGALFQINHPTSFPPPLFTNFCRGCYFELGERINWAQVDTLEILNGPVLVSGSELGIPLPQPEIETPFLATAIQLWESQLRAGHKITAVSGTDSKGVEADEAGRQHSGWGSSATAVYASQLSRPALQAAIRAGHAYIRTRGTARSPALSFTATTADGQRGIFGDSLKVDANGTVALRVTVTGGKGQLLTYIRNGMPVLSVPVTSDPFVSDLPRAGRDPANEGPLGTFWRVETRDASSRTTIGNPIFLKGE